MCLQSRLGISSDDVQLEVPLYNHYGHFKDLYILHTFNINFFSLEFFLIRIDLYTF